MSAEMMKLLESLAGSDLTLDRKDFRSANVPLDRLVDFVLSEAKKLTIVYTAFDGDHQIFSGPMRQRAIESGFVPANPDSVLGYKETVQARQSKERVLLDDLSVLRGCDELWIFTDEEADPRFCPHLAEGVLVELLYFLKRHSRPVKFLKISDFVDGNPYRGPILWTANYEETSNMLCEDQRSEILKLANSGADVDRRLVALTYFLLDPLDYKYSRFVRAKGYRKASAPLVPYLTVRLEDFGLGHLNLGRAIICWARLLSLASSMVKLPPLEPGRSESMICQLLERVWLRSKGSSGAPKSGDWYDYDVPKAVQAERWAITDRERRRFWEA